MMSDEVVAEKEREIPKQKMWPIFTVGFALMAFGFYFVFAEGEGDASTEQAIAAPVEPAEVPALETTEDTPVTFEYGGKPRRVEVQVEQRSERNSDKNIRTTIDFELVDEPAKPRDGEKFAYLRSFEKVGVGLRAGGKLLGTEVTNEVVRLLEATKLEIGFAENGERVRIEVVSSESAQLRPTLDLVNDATRLIFMPMPAEPVNPSEKWSIRLPAEVDGAEVVEVEGATKVSATLAAANADFARVETRFGGEIRTTWDDGEGSSGHLETVISGDGVWSWNQKTGDVSQVEAKLVRKTLKPDGEQLESATIVVRAKTLGR